MSFNIGDKVFDRATQRWARIIDTCVAEGDNGPFTIYILDDSVPDDEDFPHRHRLASEISLTESAPLARRFSLENGKFNALKAH